MQMNSPWNDLDGFGPLPTPSPGRSASEEAGHSGPSSSGPHVRQELHTTELFRTLIGNGGSGGYGDASQPNVRGTPLSRGGTASLPLSADANKRHGLYKTELCRTFIEGGGHCSYGDKCQFAHGPEELRTVYRHPLYKTKLCRNFANTGRCPYGDRCRFLHNFLSRDATQDVQGVDRECIMPSWQSNPSSSTWGSGSFLTQQYQTGHRDTRSSGHGINGSQIWNTVDGMSESPLNISSSQLSGVSGSGLKSHLNFTPCMQRSFEGSHVVSSTPGNYSRASNPAEIKDSGWRSWDGVSQPSWTPFQNTPLSERVEAANHPKLPTWGPPPPHSTTEPSPLKHFSVSSLTHEGEHRDLEDSKFVGATKPVRSAEDPFRYALQTRADTMDVGKCFPGKTAAAPEKAYSSAEKSTGHMTRSSGDMCEEAHGDTSRDKTGVNPGSRSTASVSSASVMSNGPPIEGTQAPKFSLHSCVPESRMRSEYAQQMNLGKGIREELGDSTGHSKSSVSSVNDDQALLDSAFDMHASRVIAELTLGTGNTLDTA